MAYPKRYFTQAVVQNVDRSMTESDAVNSNLIVKNIGKE
jgi:hypothetical protein